MRRFLYYLPGVGGANDAMLQARGLADRFPGAQPGRLCYCLAGVNDGPAGSGVIIAAGEQPPGRGTAWEEGERYWVGLEDLPPRPEDLERPPVVVEGDLIRLGPLQCLWRVPLILRYDRQRMRHVPNVPTARVQRNGGMELAVHRQFRGVFEIASRIAQNVITCHMEEKDACFPGAFADAAALLAVNYRLGVEEINLLELFDDAAIVQVLLMSIDWRSFLQHGRDLQVTGLQPSSTGILPVS